MSAADGAAGAPGPSTGLGGRPAIWAGTGPMSPPDAGDLRERRGSGRLALTAFARNRQAIAGVSLVVAITLICFLGPFLYHTNQVTVRLGLESLPPGAGHPLGTDASGYDVLGRLMVAGQASLELGLAVSLTTTIIGCVYGAIAGLVGGVIDAIMMRIIDTLLAVPILVLLLILVKMFTPNLLMIIVLISALSWLTAARLVRAEVLTLRTREFVQAAKMMGGTRRLITARHLLPNAIGVVVVTATFTIADSILTLAALDFLGLGLPPPQADWGSMLSNGLNYLFDGYWWTVYPPAAALILTVVAFNLIGDGIRDALDVRLQRR